MNLSNLSYDELSFYLRKVADEMNDAADHDEVHAAAEVAALLAGNQFDDGYIDRWFMGITDRSDIRLAIENIDWDA
jgi:hypothetical protein